MYSFSNQLTIRPFDYLTKYMGRLNVMFKKCFKLLGILCIALALTGCGSPEEKKMKFFSKGQALY